jgi:hypothetical protein
VTWSYSQASSSWERGRAPAGDVEILPVRTSKPRWPGATARRRAPGGRRGILLAELGSGQRHWGGGGRGILQPATLGGGGRREILPANGGLQAVLGSTTKDERGHRSPLQKLYKIKGMPLGKQVDAELSGLSIPCGASRRVFDIGNIFSIILQLIFNYSVRSTWSGACSVQLGMAVSRCSFLKKMIFFYL